MEFYGVRRGFQKIPRLVSLELMGMLEISAFLQGPVLALPIRAPARRA